MHIGVSRRIVPLRVSGVVWWSVVTVAVMVYVALRRRVILTP
jgi:hypothetical protein